MKTFEVAVTDKQGNKHATVRLPEERLAQYIAKHEKARTWGLPERWLDGAMLSDDEKAQAIEQREVVNDFEQAITEYKFAAEFSLVVTDVTDALVAAEQAEADRLAKREAARVRFREVAAAKPASMADVQEALRLLVELGVI